MEAHFGSEVGIGPDLWLIQRMGCFIMDQVQPKRYGLGPDNWIDNTKHLAEEFSARNSVAEDKRKNKSKLFLFFKTTRHPKSRDHDFPLLMAKLSLNWSAFPPPYQSPRLTQTSPCSTLSIAKASKPIVVCGNPPTFVSAPGRRIVAG